MTAASGGDPWVDQRRPPPPDGITKEPAIEVLSAGSRLWRIHSQACEATAFDARVPSGFTGGRFNSPAGHPGVLYASDSLEGAVAEVILRDVPLADEGARAVPIRGVLGRSVSVLEVTRELTVVILHGANAGLVGQGLWLTKSDSVDYPLTREWGSAVRATAPSAAGLLWRARHDENRFAYALYEDKAEGALAVQATLAIDGGIGLAAVRKILLAHRAVIEG